MSRQHYNSPDRFSAPWIDAGMHKTRTAGSRRLWLREDPNPMTPGSRWSCVVAGEGSTCGATREEALERGKNW